MTSKLAPQVEHLTAANLGWVATALAVKAIDNATVFQTARPDALRVWRHFEATQDTTDPEGTVDRAIAALGGYQHPLLVLELWNEQHPTADQMRRAVTHAHERGYRVAIGSWGTGDYTQTDWDGAVASGADFIAVHGYWSPEVGPTVWNAYRWRQFWQPGHPLVLVTECGDDNVRDGPQNTYVGKPGWRADGLTVDQVIQGFTTYLASLATDPAVAFAFPFGEGLTPDWLPFDLDAVSAQLALLTSPTSTPTRGGPMEPYLYLHQFDQLGETTVAQIAATCRLGHVAEVRVKTHQYTTPTGHFDTSPLKLDSLAAMAQRRDQFAAEGIRLTAWCVPMGEDLAGEGAYTQQVAALFGNHIDLDLEPYRGFWDGDKAGLLPYLQRLKAAGVTFDVNFDARSGGETFPQFAAAVALADHAATQSYWTDFRQPALATVSAALANLASLGLPPSKRAVIVPWNGSADYAAVAALLSAQGTTRLGVWKMGDAGPATYAALAALPRPAPVTPPLTPPPTVPAPWNAYGQTWEQVAGALKGIADDALAAGRTSRDLARQIVTTWGTR